MIEEIHEEATDERSFGTKKSALETMRKIDKSITLAPSTLGHEVRKHFQCEPCLEKGMIDILKSMNVHERQDMADSTDEKGSFLDKTISLRNKCDSLCIMEGLNDVVKCIEDALEGHWTDEDSNPGESLSPQDPCPEESSDGLREDEKNNGSD